MTRRVYPGPKSEGKNNPKGRPRTYAVKNGMNSSISINCRLLAAKLDDLAHDHHDFAFILLEVGTGDAGGGRGAVHFVSVLFWCVSGRSGVVSEIS